MGLYLPNAKISDVHGQALKVKGRLVVPMYHPAAALHQGSLKPVVERDFSKLPDLIAKAAEVPEYEGQNSGDGDNEEPKQLSLF